MRAIFLSPHFDDAIFSCGGLIHSLVAAGLPVEIWTLCAGSPPDAPPSEFAASLHTRWGLNGAEVVAVRRAEDIAACALLGAVPRHLPLPDCIYRRDVGGAFLYASEEAIFGPLHPDDIARQAELANWLLRDLGPQDDLYVPLAVGNHVDHQLARRVAGSLGCPLYYYADVPYALRPDVEFEALLPQTADHQVRPISESALKAWGTACLAYASQINSFWNDENALRSDLSSYLNSAGGLRLWHTGEY